MDLSYIENRLDYWAYQHRNAQDEKKTEQALTKLDYYFKKYHEHYKIDSSQLKLL